MKTFRAILLIIFIIASIANLGLSMFIQQQKVVNEQIATDNNLMLTNTSSCFVGNGGCATVQTSVYANTFGVSNPLIGVVVFFVLAIIFSLQLVSVWHQHLASKLRKFVGLTGFSLSVILGAGCLFSLWLLFVQFFLLHTTCKFCLWVDGIMIGMAILYLIFKDLLLD